VTTQSRIVIELAPGPLQRESLEAAAALAVRVGAELVGIFVEDMDLLRFAALPFAREVCFVTAQRRRLEVPALERLLREHAAEAERTFAGMAGRAAVRHSFRVARGLAFRELLAAATGAAAGAAMRGLHLLLLGDGGSPATHWAEQARLRLGGPAGTATPAAVIVRGGPRPARDRATAGSPRRRGAAGRRRLAVAA
jgi:hypothetical protein